MIDILLDVQIETAEIDFTIGGGAELGFDVESPVVIQESDIPIYDGDYTFTPTESAQEIEIESKRATQNIVIQPIPSNYGRIAWNGSTLSVY